MPGKTIGTIYEVAVRTGLDDNGNVEILKELLINQGVASDEIIESVSFPYKFVSLYFTSRSKAISMKKRLKTFSLKDAHILSKVLKKKDWQTKWKEEFKPFHLTKTFGVIPIAYRAEHRFRGRIPIYIDTDLAFGTGLHATTRFMAQLIDRQKGDFKSFLDLGTGTGILSIIAEKCGAENIRAVDISESAVKVAERNCAQNGCHSVSVSAGDVGQLRIKEKYDFVAANIITQELIRLSDKIVRMVKPGKYLAVSGISFNSYEAFRQAYAKYPLRCVKIERGEGWVAVLFKKSLNKDSKI